MKRRIQKDAGFTLIEVIVSLAILALLIVPVLSSYVSAAKVNREARIDQKAATLGQNLMEAIKNGDFRKTAMMFNGACTFSLINSNLSGFTDTYHMKAYADNGYGEYILNGGSYHKVLTGEEQCSIKLIGSPLKPSFSPPEGKGTFLFGIENITDGSCAFDALITLDATSYRDTLEYSDSFNNYKMPDLKELINNEVTILDMEGFTTSWSDDSESAVRDTSKSTDRQALEELKNIRLSYLVYLEGLPVTEGVPTPVPAIGYSEEDIKNATSKNIRINVKKDSLENKIQIDCKVEYICSLDLNGDGFEERISYELYSENTKILENMDYDREIYLFYSPSDFPGKDTISVSNDGTKIKLTIVKQDGTSVKDAIVNKTESHSANTLICSNLSTGSTLITNNEAEDRIYNSKVAIYKAGSIASGDLTEPYVTFSSTKK